jgi:hypothetical protein
VGEIISERRATSNRNGGRDHSGIVGDIERNQQASESSFANFTSSASLFSILRPMSRMTRPR